MILWCEACRKNHEFSAEDAERLVYCLVGDLVYAAGHDGENLPDDDGWYPCLERTLSSAFDIEAYGEFVAESIEARESNPQPSHTQDVPGGGESL